MATSTSQADSSVSEDYGLIYPLNTLLSCLANIDHTAPSFFSIIGLLFSYFGLYQEYHNDTGVKSSGPLLGSKIFIASCFVVTEMAAIAGWNDVPYPHQSLIPVVVSCLAVFAIPLEHLYAAHSTAAVALSLVVTLVSDWSRFLDYRSDPALRQLKLLATLAFALKCVLLVLNELPRIVSEEESPNQPTGENDDTQRYSKGVWTRILFSGFSFQPAFSVVHEVRPTLSPKSLYSDFQARRAKVGSNGPYCLLFALTEPMTVPLIKIMALGLVLSLFTLSQATFFKRYFTFSNESDRTDTQKAGIIAIILLIHYGLANSRSSFRDHTTRTAKQMQMALAGAVHKKFASLPCSDVQTREITSTVSSDIDSVSDTILSFCGIIWDFIEVAVCARWLMQSIGNIAILFEVAFIVYFMLFRHFGDKLNTADRALDETTSTRVTIASTVLAQVKAIQIAGLTGIISKLQETCRALEMEQYMKVASALSSRVKIAEFYYTAPGFFVISIMHLTAQAGQVTTQEAFFTLVTVYLLFEALRRSVQSCGNIHIMLCSIERIQAFLCMEEASDLTLLDRHSTGPSNEKATAQPATTAAMPPVDCVVDTQEASLTLYSAKKKSIITNLSLSVQRNELVMVAGPVGCGKSTLLRSLIGDGVLREGKFWREPGVAGYCDHEPWLQNASIQQNIIGRNPLDLDWYDAVLNACLLTEDVHNLVHGDRTIIGNNSSNLSHGQEHRVALARALYMRAPFLILDGIFSVLDSDTASRIFERIFGERGLLVTSPSTAVLTTHSRVLLSKADKVVLINSTGTASVHNDVNSTHFQRQLDQIDLSKNGTKLNDKRRYSHRKQPDCMQSPDAMDDESGIIDQLYLYLCTFSRWDLARVLGSMLISAFGVSLREYSIHLWLKFNPQSSFVFTGCVIVTCITGVIMMYGASVWYLDVSPIAANDIHRQLLDSTMQANIAYLSRTPHQTMLNLHGADMKILTRQMPKFFLATVHKTFITLLQMALIIGLIDYAYVVLGALVIGMSIALVGYCRSARVIHSTVQKNRAARNAAVVETASGVRHIRAFGWQSQVSQNHLDLLQESHGCAYDLKSIDRWLEFVLDLTKGASTAALLGIDVFNDKGIEPSITAVLMLVLIICTDNFVLFAQYFERFTFCLRSLKRIHRAIKAMKPDPEVSLDAKDLPQQWPSAGNVTLRSVTASYDAKSLVPPVLKMLTLSIPSGHKVAIVGRSGSGKTSLLLALLNFLDCEGSIEIDGIDTSTLPANFVRQHISTISTEVIELQGTVRANICPWTIGKSKDENTIHSKAIYLVLKTLGIWIPLKRNGGLDADITALDFSHEERQLLSVARGMLYNLYIGSNLVLMDETDNDLDPTTEMIVHNTMKQVFDDHTVIRVMSRPDFLKDTDMTIRMLGGRISEVTVNSQGPAAIKETGRAVDRAERKRYQEAAKQRAAEQSAAKRQASAKQAGKQRAATQQETTQQATEQSVSTLRAAAQRAAEQRAAEQRAAEQQAAEQQAAEQQAAAQRAAEQQAAAQRAAAQRAAAQRAATQQTPEQRAAAQRAATQRATTQRAIQRVATASGSSTAAPIAPQVPAMEALFQNMMFVTDNPDAELPPDLPQEDIEQLRYAQEVRRQWERRSITDANTSEAEIELPHPMRSVNSLRAASARARRLREESRRLEERRRRQERRQRENTTPGE